MLECNALIHNKIDEKIDEDAKKKIIQDLNIAIGTDINDLALVHLLEGDFIEKKERLESCLKEVSAKFLPVIRRAEQNLKQIEDFKGRAEILNVKVEGFLDKTQPLRNELHQRFDAIKKLEETHDYLQSIEKIDDLSRQLKQCSDDEQAVLLYGELKEICILYQKGHRAAYAKEQTHYWHVMLKDKLAKHYEELLNILKWPNQAVEETSSSPKEILSKLRDLTKYLFLIQEPENLVSNNVTELSLEKDPCLPVKILLRPLKKRFLFHFTGNRITARIDRPEWFLSQTLKWIKMHHSFVRTQIQPVADKLQMKKVRAVDEFIAGVVSLAAERLHTVLGLYNTQGSKGELADMDAAFAHAVDETLGFHKELSAITGNDANGVLSVLTKAEIFVKWLVVEKKYALAKMDETLGNEQWSESVAAGMNVAVGAVVWVPKGADWFIALLRHIELRYAVLPQPGHRIQFLELQLDLVEEWRVRLTQLMNAALAVMLSDRILTADSPRQLIAVINAAHHTTTVLLQWTHSLHYLQLHYYRRQFQHFTQQQHHDSTETSGFDNDHEHSRRSSLKAEHENDETMSLNEVEQRAQKLALDEVARRESTLSGQKFQISPMLLRTFPMLKRALDMRLGGEEMPEDAGVFGEAPALLAHLRDEGLTALADRIFLEFKVAIRPYKLQRWHVMTLVEEGSLTVSPALCQPLSALCMRMTRAADSLAPALAHRLRSQLAASLDQYIFKEVVLESFFNTGGIAQFIHDVKRSIVPAFAPPNKIASRINLFPKLVDACKLLSSDFEEARRIRNMLIKKPDSAEYRLLECGIRHINNANALEILNQRIDGDAGSSSPSSVMMLF